MRQNEINYLNAMAQANTMLVKGIISSSDYKEIETKMASKYCINDLSLYRAYDLINKPKRVIDMIPNSGGEEDGNNTTN